MGDADASMMRAPTSLLSLSLSLSLLPVLPGCSPLVELGEPASDVESEVAEDIAEFFEQDDDIYRDLTERCGCDTELYADYGWRLESLQQEALRMQIEFDAECAQDLLERLEGPGCEFEGSLPDCRILLGERRAGEPCSLGVVLDDCGPSLFCLTGSSTFPAEGTCVQQAVLGEACEHRSHACGEGACIRGICEAEATSPGDPCSLECGNGLICTQGACREPDKCDIVPSLRG